MSVGISNRSTECSDSTFRSQSKETYLSDALDIAKKANRLAVPIVALLVVASLTIVVAETVADDKACQEVCQTTSDGKGGWLPYCKNVCKVTLKATGGIAHAALTKCIEECEIVRQTVNLVSESSGTAAYWACRAACGTWKYMYP